ncbi:MAG: DMT family transporter [Anaerolineae bacterium]
MYQRLSPHTRAVLQGLLVALLWSTSWIFIKFGLSNIPPLTFAGLRYMLAFLCLLPIAARGGHLRSLSQLAPRKWGTLLTLGFILYTVAQGSQFVGLRYLPAVTTNLLISFTSIVVTLLGIVLLREHPTRMQWGGIALYLVGVLVYFYPVSFSPEQLIGVLVIGVNIAANTTGTLIGRSVNRAGDLHPIAVTTATMGIGAICLLAGGIVLQGLPALTVSEWAMIGWLAVVNTALGFTLWNNVQRTLSAMEASMINNTMLIHIPILALLFLGESISEKALLGMVLAGVGIVAVQMGRGIQQRRAAKSPNVADVVSES